MSKYNCFDARYTSTSTYYCINNYSNILSFYVTATITTSIFLTLLASSNFLLLAYFNFYFNKIQEEFKKRSARSILYSPRRQSSQDSRRNQQESTR